ncbi:transcription factor DIVARICATA [Diospyros lotus]|uniref:transcription factor DIVARICATA n=1 Tax=Diospyros lotus TaxID=55363 RepID=UPI002252520C|nr:transcription factor DIVARICATA [Diospyros lotus]
MNQRMEILSPSSYIRNANWLFEESKGAKWTPEENKQFENALALFDKDTPDRWHNVAAMIPGKTVSDVIKQYRELEEDVSDIEAGLIPIPGYNNSSFTLEWVNNQDSDDLKQYYSPGGKQNSSTRPSDHERKKGVPWTEEEHRQFLMGLKKYGKGDWRNISRNFVTSRTPTQVASHAQKYFIRQLSGGKDKRRSSIHDITTSDLTDTKSPSPDSKRPCSPDQSSMVKQPQQHTNMNAMAAELYNWNQTNQGVNMAFSLPNNNLLIATSCGTSSYGLELQAQNLQNHALHGHAGTRNIIFEMQSIQRQ